MNLLRFLLPLTIALIAYDLNTSLAQNMTNDKGFAVVELFTSEGCSSCPAAEKELSRLHDEYKDVCFLEFHVDYWNYLGWKDEYSNKTYTKRQQDYAQTFGLNSTYTPQAIVNGSKEMVGSDNNQLQSAIKQGLKHRQSSELEIKAVSAGRSLTVSYNAGNADGLLNIALVQLHAETNVKNGENSGRKLVHTNVVRVFKTIHPEKGQSNIIIELPEGLSKNDCHIIGYLQKKGGDEIIAAKEIKIDL
jgi:hypothetical protein